MAPRRLVLLFGAFDRHNFGDLLFPHSARALLPKETETMCGYGTRKPCGRWHSSGLQIT